jgi:hypothetical protein
VTGVKNFKKMTEMMRVKGLKFSSKGWMVREVAGDVFDRGSFCGGATWRS